MTESDAGYIADYKSISPTKGSVIFFNAWYSVDPFYDLLCAGEETKRKFIGSKTLDAGDIKQTLTGWTCMGFGRVDVPVFNFSFGKSGFTTRNSQIAKGVQAMEQALANLSLEM